MNGQRPTIEMLDRMFANHFGVSPVMHEGGSSSSSLYSVPRPESSRASTESSNSPRTPANTLLGLGSSPSKSGYSVAPIDDHEKTVKVQNLLSALAELYNAPAAARGDDTHADVQKQIETLRRSLAGGQMEDLSPKSAGAELPSVDENRHDRGRRTGDSSHRTSASTISSSILGAAGVQRTADGLAALQTRNASPRKADGKEAASDAAIWPVDEPSLHEVGKPEDVGNVRARRESKVATNGVRPMGPLTQIYYRVETIPRRACSDIDTRDELVRHFPQLCEAPHVVMYDDQGVALPPLKYEETSKEERKARKNGLTLRVRGKKMHTLVKSMVVLESRSSHWKKVGNHASSKRTEEPTTPTAHATPQRGSSRAAAPRLPEVPSPWALNFMHSDEETLSITGTARRIFELSESRAYGQCPKCQGERHEACATCKGEAPDECFWCDGSGREKRKHHLKCQPCLGTGKLVCKACNGSLQSACRTCDGEGRGEFCAYVQIKVRRVNFAPVPITSLISSGNAAQDPEAVRAAATERTWESINKLTDASGAKHRHPFRPLAAACFLQTSWSDLIEVTVPTSASHHHARGDSNSGSNGHSSPSLLKRTRSLNTFKHTATMRSSKSSQQQHANDRHRYFVVPSDADLQPAEVDVDEFELALAPDIRPQPHSNFTTPSPSPSASPPSRSLASPHAVAQRAVSNHSRSHSARLPSGIASGSVQSQPGRSASPAPATAPPMTAPSIFGGIQPADVAAWQAQMRSMAPLQTMMMRPVSPTSQLGSLPGTPNERYNGGGSASEAGYFGGHQGWTASSASSHSVARSPQPPAPSGLHLRIHSPTPSSASRHPRHTPLYNGQAF